MKVKQLLPSTGRAAAQAKWVFTGHPMAFRVPEEQAATTGLAAPHSTAA